MWFGCTRAHLASWIVDLPNGAIERHNDPSEGGYRRMVRVGRGRSLVSEALPDLTLNTDAVVVDHADEGLTFEAKVPAAR